MKRNTALLCVPVPRGRKVTCKYFHLPGHQGGTGDDFDPPSPGSLLSSRDPRVKAGLAIIPYPPLNDRLTLLPPASGGGGITGRTTLDTTVNFGRVA